MEVREIIETNIKEPIIEVKFRLDTDDDDVFRSAEFQLDEIEEYGYQVLNENFDLFDFDDDWEDEDYEYPEDDDEDLIFDEEYGWIPPPKTEEAENPVRIIYHYKNTDDDVQY